MEKRRASAVEWHDRVSKWHTVFVNNVSKRIHSETLKETFQAYGVVTDVFIAYRSRRRETVGSTFAFVRFRSKSEADTAVRRADGRIMDGFKIRVFHDNKGAAKSRGLRKKVSIVFNGRLYSIKISTEVQEEIRVFIDGSMAGGSAWCSDAEEAGEFTLIKEEYVDGVGPEAEMLWGSYACFALSEE
ncbi:uncharacterized protein LOC120133680 [Hibiscus syriacus]|uniref:uncharacterized protein LOC120133680 n=1 Tax=Hibiscus syriacus TaxID=106335 RepID=UPI0019249611|nr:uncharacterized protein LOC120133680 [Hibiscus syriacus]